MRFIVFDLDGTLAPSKQRVDAECAKQLSRLLKEGWIVAVISGGMWAQFEKQLLPYVSMGIKHRLYCFPCSGAMMYEVSSLRTKRLYNHEFSLSEKANIMTAFSDVLRLTNVQQKIKKTWGEQFEDRQAQITWSALGQQAPLDEKQGFDPDHLIRAEIAMELQKRLPDCTVKIGGTTSIDVTKKGIDKAFAIKQLVNGSYLPQEFYGKIVEKIIYVGDALYPGGNDEAVLSLKEVRAVSVKSPVECLEVMRKMV